MSRIITFKEILVGYAFAGAILSLGLYFGTRTEYAAAADFIIKGCYAIALIVVLAFTFAWGRLRGYPVLTVGGDLSLSNLLRNLVMTVIVSVAVCVLIAPIAAFLILRSR